MCALTCCFTRIEFDVDNVEAATAKLASQGHRILVRNRNELWGQAVSRFIGQRGCW